MTTDEAYERLGLEPRHEFKLAAMRRNLSEERVAALGAETAIDQVHRATGRSTFNLIVCLRKAADDGWKIQHHETHKTVARRALCTAEDYAARLGYGCKRMAPDVLSIWTPTEDGGRPPAAECGRVLFEHG